MRSEHKEPGADDLTIVPISTNREKQPKKMYKMLSSSIMGPNYAVQTVNKNPELAKLEIGSSKGDKMVSRSFRVFGTKKDLDNIFNEFQKNNIVNYYRCGKSDSNKITDITKTDNFGFSLSGSHIGNQYLVIKGDKIVRLDNYKHIYQKLNETSIVIDLGGLYAENIILPTTVSTIWYENESSKKIYNNLKSIIKRYSVSIVNGYMILKNAYDKKEQLRFVTISVQSPKEYDLKL